MSLSRDCTAFYHSLSSSLSMSLSEVLQVQATWREEAGFEVKDEERLPVRMVACTGVERLLHRVDLCMQRIWIETWSCRSYLNDEW